MLELQDLIIESAKPNSGKEGTIVTLTGRGFASHVRNNCIIMAGMGACARALPGGTDTEIQVKIGPVAKLKRGKIMAWTGAGLEIFTQTMHSDNSSLSFDEIAIFRNGTPQATSGFDFELTEESPNTYAGEHTTSANRNGVRFQGGAIRVEIPKSANISTFRKVDVCIVLKEPTVAIDIVAELTAETDIKCMKLISRAIEANAALVGETVLTDVLETKSHFELWISKPYLSRSMANFSFT